MPILGIGIWEVKVWDVTLNFFCKRKITFLFLCFSGFCNVKACLFCTNEKNKKMSTRLKEAMNTAGEFSRVGSRVTGYSYPSKILIKVRGHSV